MTTESTSQLPPDSLQALIERDEQGQLLEQLRARFDGKNQVIETERQSASGEFDEFLQKLQVTVAVAQDAIQSVWTMYHGETESS